MSTVPVPKRVAAFIAGGKPNGFCDDCIAAALKLKRRQQAQQATAALGVSREYVRRDGRCSVCGAAKTVIHKI
jgi:hypothetical protein